MSKPQIPEAAKRAAHDTYCSEPDCDHQYDEVLENILAAAYPHIERAVIERLIAKADAQDHAEPSYQALAVRLWLRAGLEEGNAL